MKTKKTRVVQNLGNDHPFVEGLDAKKTMPLVRNLQKTPTKRVTTHGHGKTYFFFLLFHTSFFVTSENVVTDFFYSIHFMNSRKKDNNVPISLELKIKNMMHRLKFKVECIAVPPLTGY